jgi:hypothetical protein
MWKKTEHVDKLIDDQIIAGFTDVDSEVISFGSVI